MPDQDQDPVEVPRKELDAQGKELEEALEELKVVEEVGKTFLDGVSGDVSPAEFRAERVIAAAQRVAAAVVAANERRGGWY